MATKIHLSSPVGRPAARGLVRGDVQPRRWFLMCVTNRLTNGGVYVSSLYAGIKHDDNGTCTLINMRRGQSAAPPDHEFHFGGVSDNTIAGHVLPETEDDDNIRFVRYLNRDEFVGMSGMA